MHKNPQFDNNNPEKEIIYILSQTTNKANI